jgi:hypothetical protein
MELTKTSLYCKLVCMKNPIREYIRLHRAIKQALREGRMDEFIKAAKERSEAVKERAELQKTIWMFTLRPKRYETINGAGEIGWGAMMLCCAFSCYASVVLPASAWGGWIGFFFLGCACVAMPVSRWACRKFVTEPRVGYVTFRRDPWWWTAIVVAVVVGGSLAATLPFLRRPEIIQTTHAVTHHATPTAPGEATLAGQIIKFSLGPLSALLYLMMNALSIKEHHWKWLLLILIVTVPLGICYFVPGNYIEVSRPMMLFLGLIWFVSGAVTLFSFLRRHQPLAPETE